MTKTAVVVPIYRNDIYQEEIFSLIHIVHYLGFLPKFLICSEELQVRSDVFEVVNFPGNYFKNIYGYNQLMLSADFYSRFEQYSHILIVQLDALVLSSQIDNFTQNGWDYIGAPWFLDYRNPQKGFKGAGNGGLSLRHVSAFVDVLTKGKFTIEQALGVILERSGYELRDLTTDPPLLRQLKKVNFVRKAIHRGNRFVEKYDWNEDHFWAFRAPIFFEDFRVAPVDMGLKFAFETHPRYCLQINNNQLPFGCHAWAKYDPKFWKPYLISDDRIKPSLSEIIRFS